MRIEQVLEAAPYRLTSTQQEVIATISASATPVAAYDATSGSQNLLNARKALETLGAVSISGNGVELTQRGQQYALDYDIVDETGELTENGQELVSNAEEDKGEWQATQP